MVSRWRVDVVWLAFFVRALVVVLLLWQGFWVREEVFLGTLLAALLAWPYLLLMAQSLAAVLPPTLYVPVATRIAIRRRLLPATLGLCRFESGKRFILLLFVFRVLGLVVGWSPVF